MDRPILFSAPMIRSILSGEKTMTRRVIKPRPWNRAGDAVNINIAKSAAYVTGADGRMYFHFEHPKGGPLTAYVAKIVAGDRLWVREAWRAWSQYDDTATRDIPPVVDIQYDADAPLSPWASRKRPGMFMPRWASRITLYVTDVRVQRLQDISREDALAEGVQRVGGGMLRWENWSAAEGQSGTSPQAAYALLWNNINGPGSWDANPWVAAYTFVPRLGNIDALPATIEEAA